ncbi:hypothetical protein F0225_02920 [Vibrio pectenicida]|uniref:Uncharacterized protein n=1 Tax=Vibrio pectenicida TaxID=62763 RepID=A0A7Y4ED51_9VIBR|nr:hypothetical protein [Vibrio pectenicida]NOH70294.1 hypothetical protein [Vibrio pectenicida]
MNNTLSSWRPNIPSRISRNKFLSFDQPQEEGSNSVTRRATTLANMYWFDRDGERVVKSACQHVFSSLSNELGSQEVKSFKPNKATNSQQKSLLQTKVNEDDIRQHMVSYAALKWDHHVQRSSIEPTLEQKTQVLKNISNWLGVSSVDASKSFLESAVRVIVDKQQLEHKSMITGSFELKRAVRDRIDEITFESVTREINKIVNEYILNNKLLGSDGKYITSRRIDQKFEQELNKIYLHMNNKKIVMFNYVR